MPRGVFSNLIRQRARLVPYFMELQIFQVRPQPREFNPELNQSIPQSSWTMLTIIVTKSETPSPNALHERGRVNQDLKRFSSHTTQSHSYKSASRRD